MNNCTKYICINKEREGGGSSTIYVVQRPQGVGQNKNTIKMAESIEILTNTIKAMLDGNQKITIRSLVTESGLAKKTVEKYYKSILEQLKNEIRSVA